MTPSSTWMRTLILSCIILCIAFAVSASGSAEKPLVMATVDFAKIDKEYKLKATLESDLKTMEIRLQEALRRRDTWPLLSEVEQKELDKLYEKDVASRSADEKKRIDELQTRGAQLAAEITSLQQKQDKDLTEADRKKLRETSDTIGKAQQTFANMREESNTKLRQYVTENQEVLEKNVRQVIAKVAEQKAVTIVFNAQFVPYAGVDITAPVIADLNKK